MAKFSPSHHQSVDEQRRPYQQRTWCTKLIILGGLSASSVFAEPKLLDRIVAEVNAKTILYSEVTQKIATGPLVEVSDFPATAKDTPFLRALQDLVNKQLLLQKAKELDIQVDEDQVDSQIDNILQNNGMNRDGLNNFLREQRKTMEEYKQDLHDQMVFMRFKGRVLIPLVKITDKDLESYYLKKVGNSAQATELALRQILIATNEGMTASMVKEKESLAQEVYSKLQSGLSFLEAAKIYSDRSDARETVPAQLYKLGDLTPAIRKEVEKLEVHQFTPPLKTVMGFHLFYLEDKKFSGNQEYLAKKNELESELRNQELNRQMGNWLQEARQRSKIRLVLE